jgi:hypothetical protein
LYVEQNDSGYHWWFPSGQSFAEAGAYGRTYGFWGALPWFIHSMLGITDKALSGAHYLMDYTAGAAISSFLGYTFAMRYSAAHRPGATTLRVLPFWQAGPFISLQVQF